MGADDIRQRKFSDSEKPKKDKKKTEMINIETSGNAKFIADDKYKLIEDFGTDSEDEEEEEILQQNGKVSNTNVTILPHQIGQTHNTFSRIFLINFICSENDKRLALHRTKVRWRLRKILWPSQNI